MFFLCFLPSSHPSCPSPPPPAPPIVIETTGSLNDHHLIPTSYLCNSSVDSLPNYMPGLPSLHEVTQQADSEDGCWSQGLNRLLQKPQHPQQHYSTAPIEGYHTPSPELRQSTNTCTEYKYAGKRCKSGKKGGGKKDLFTATSIKLNKSPKLSLLKTLVFVTAHCSFFSLQYCLITIHFIISELTI